MKVFFLSNDNIFGDLETSKVNHFKKIWQSDRLTIEDRDAIWRWFSAFIKICEKSKKRNLIISISDRKHSETRDLSSYCWYDRKFYYFYFRCHIQVSFYLFQSTISNYPFKNIFFPFYLH